MAGRQVGEDAKRFGSLSESSRGGRGGREERRRKRKGGGGMGLRLME